MANNCPRQDLEILREPLCLIESEENGRLVINESVVGQLSRLDKPCVVVAIAGLYRTGKSYIMNRLAGHTNGQYSTVQIQLHCKVHIGWKTKSHVIMASFKGMLIAQHAVEYIDT